MLSSRAERSRASGSTPLADPGKIQGVILHLDTVLLFVLGNEPIDLAASQVDEPVAALAVKPVAVQSSGTFSAPKSSVVAFGSVFLAVEDERICKPVFLEVMEGSVYGYLIAKVPEVLIDRCCRKGLRGQ